MVYCIIHNILRGHIKVHSPQVAFTDAVQLGPAFCIVYAGLVYVVCSYVLLDYFQLTICFLRLSYSDESLQLLCPKCVLLILLFPSKNRSSFHRTQEMKLYEVLLFAKYAFSVFWASHGLYAKNILAFREETSSSQIYDFHRKENGAPPICKGLIHKYDIWKEQCTMNKKDGVAPPCEMIMGSPEPERRSAMVHYRKEYHLIVFFMVNCLLASKVLLILSSFCYYAWAVTVSRSFKSS